MSEKRSSSSAVTSAPSAEISSSGCLSRRQRFPERGDRRLVLHRPYLEPEIRRLGQARSGDSHPLVGETDALYRDPERTLLRNLPYEDDGLPLGYADEPVLQSQRRDDRDDEEARDLRHDPDRARTRVEGADRQQLLTWFEDGIEHLECCFLPVGPLLGLGTGQWIDQLLPIIRGLIRPRGAIPIPVLVTPGRIRMPTRLHVTRTVWACHAVPLSTWIAASIRTSSYAFEGSPSSFAATSVVTTRVASAAGRAPTLATARRPCVRAKVVGAPAAVAPDAVFLHDDAHGPLGSRRGDDAARDPTVARQWAPDPITVKTEGSSSPSTDE